MGTVGTHTRTTRLNAEHGEESEGRWPQALASGTGNLGGGRFEGPGLITSGKVFRRWPGCACLVDKKDKTWEAGCQQGLPPAKGKEGPLEPEQALDLPLGCPASPVRT